jgi:hypothetical protein
MMFETVYAIRRTELLRHEIAREARDARREPTRTRPPLGPLAVAAPRTSSLVDRFVAAVLPLRHPIPMPMGD